MVVATMHLGGTRKSIGMDVPNVLIYLITIYDDEEISGVSLITLVPITEEGKPGERYAPTLKSLTSIPPEGDNTTESILDTKFLEQ